MKSAPITVYDILACPRCKGALAPDSGRVACTRCSASFPVVNGAPTFLESLPEKMEVSPKKDRSSGSAWRLANNAFFKRVAERLKSDAVVLDVGAGHGYLREYFAPNYLSSDIYPYSGLDVICDLATVSPLREKSVDLVVLNNVMEHLDRPHEVLRSVADGLKPGGGIAIAVPFIIKVHQAPYDFFRYTHFMLQKMLQANGFGELRIEAVYTPAALHRTFLKEMVDRWPAGSGGKRMLKAASANALWTAVRAANRMIGARTVFVEELDLSGAEAPNPWITGYHVHATKA